MKLVWQFKQFSMVLNRCAEHRDAGTAQNCDPSPNANGNVVDRDVLEEREEEGRNGTARHVR
jgi:hypothetical protein